MRIVTELTKGWQFSGPAETWEEALGKPTETVEPAPYLERRGWARRRGLPPGAVLVLPEAGDNRPSGGPGGLD